ncbi:MAG: hypothetical protein U5K36_14970 [Roseovarius sp.]|nr:hypothetical protein [Roseovarius sp.]
MSELLTRPRLRPITLQEVSSALQTVDWSKGEIEREDLLAFYHPETLKKLEALRLWIAQRAPLGGDADHVTDWIRMVAINRLSGHSPGFFSGRSMPPNQAVSIKAQLRINEKLGVSPPERDVAAVILKKSKSLLRDGSVPSQACDNLQTGSAWDVPGIADASVDLTVTSPPFLDIVQYAADNWLRCWFAGIDPKTVAIDMHRTEEAWTAMVRRVLCEQARILRPGGYVAFEVGEVRGGKVLLERARLEGSRVPSLRPPRRDDQRPAVHQDGQSLGCRERCEGRTRTGLSYFNVIDHSSPGKTDLWHCSQRRTLVEKPFQSKWDEDRTRPRIPDHTGRHSRVSHGRTAGIVHHRATPYVGASGLETRPI